MTKPKPKKQRAPVDEEVDEDEDEDGDGDDDEGGEADQEFEMDAESARANAMVEKEKKRAPGAKGRSGDWKSADDFLKWQALIVKFAQGAKILLKKTYPKNEELPPVLVSQLRSATGAPQPDLADLYTYIRSRHWKGEDEVYLWRWSNAGVWRMQGKLELGEDPDARADWLARRDRLMLGGGGFMSRGENSAYGRPTPHAGGFDAPDAGGGGGWNEAPAPWELGLERARAANQQRAQQQPPPQQQQPQQFQPQFQPQQPLPDEGTAYGGQVMPKLPKGFAYIMSPEGRLTIQQVGLLDGQQQPMMQQQQPPTASLMQDPVIQRILQQNDELMRQLVDVTRARGAPPGMSESIAQQAAQIRENMEAIVVARNTVREFGSAFGMVDQMSAEKVARESAEQAAAKARAEEHARLAAQLTEQAREGAEMPAGPVAAGGASNAAQMFGGALGAFSRGFVPHGPVTPVPTAAGAAAAAADGSAALATVPPAVPAADPTIVNGPFGARGRKLPDGSTDWFDLELNGELIGNVATMAWTHANDLLEAKKKAATADERREIEAIQLEKERLRMREQAVLLAEREAVAAGIKRGVESGEISIDPEKARTIRDEMAERIKREEAAAAAPTSGPSGGSAGGASSAFVDMEYEGG